MHNIHLIFLAGEDVAAFVATIPDISSESEKLRNQHQEGADLKDSNSQEDSPPPLYVAGHGMDVGKARLILYE